MPLYALGPLEPSIAQAECYVAPTAAVIGGVTLEPGASVWFNAVVRADNEAITVGRDTNIQDGAVLHADPGKPLVLGRQVSVGHKAMLHGCRVHDGSLIGMNAVVLNEAVIGAGSIVGAGSLVPEGRQIPAGVLALGAPVRVVRALTREELAWLLEVARSYAERARRYRLELRALSP
ncbi:MAG: gamma carbonic anhydrase family protein [Burkholderiales bacterium]|nr:gamma carbonic anhydrase family protein [Burkholderiales bacterium]